MPVVSPERFERLVGGLDGAGLAAFVADVWAARGREATVDGSRVVVDDRTVVRCLPANGVRRIPDPDDPDGPDVVATGWPTPPEWAGDHRVLGPADLRGMLLYAVDREAAARLFEDHFGRPLDVEPPAPRLPTPRLGSGRSVLLLGLLVVIAGSLASASGAGFGILAGGQGAAPTPVTEPAPTTGPPTDPTTAATARGTPPAGYPPGLGLAGVTNVTALAGAHRDAVADSRWDLRFRYEGTPDLLNPDRFWINSRQTVVRENASHYLYKVTGRDQPWPYEGEVIIFDEYADGSDRYRRVAGAPEGTYEVLGLRNASHAGPFADTSVEYVRWYLATPESEVAVIRWDNTTWYRVTATGRPTDVDGPFTNYTAVAVVSREGLVRWMTVEYYRPVPVPRTDAAPQFRFEQTRFVMVFRDFGAATVSPPPWFVRGTATDASNGSTGADGPAGRVTSQPSGDRGANSTAVTPRPARAGR